VSYIEQKEAPKREDRLGACISYGGSGCTLKKQFGGGCFRESSRGFCQGSICQLLPGTSILYSLPDTVVIVHGAIGCGGAGNSQGASLRIEQIRKGNSNPKGLLWLSTNLNERDVVSGGEAKLTETVLEADRRYRPAAIVVLSSCVPGIIGDDIDGVAARLQPQVSAKLLPVHCEGFKTRIMATAYDAIYHSIANHLLEFEEEDLQKPLIPDELADATEKVRRSRLVNLMNVSSMTLGDEQELIRLLQALGLEVNLYPVSAHPDQMKYATEAALSISSCPTHDDYFLKYLEAKYGIPYVLKHTPIGIANTNQWLREIAAFFNLTEVAEQIIASETAELNRALEPYRAGLHGKKVILSAGEMRTLATAVWLQELGMEVVAVRPYHYDQFGEVELDKLLEQNSGIPVNVATAHPFEGANLIEKLKPDLYLGHMYENVWAAKSGIPVLPIFGGVVNTYAGYSGAFDIARRIHRILKNPSFNRRLKENVRQPYYRDWYQAEPFQYIRAGGDC
jgi:nitrogenase molybdenum-iron protein alpha chain